MCRFRSRRPVPATSSRGAARRANNCSGWSPSTSLAPAQRRKPATRDSAMPSWRGGPMGQLTGPTDPTTDAGWSDIRPRKGFFTDTSICIGCKACEVACKEWNRNPRDGDLELLGSSYDNSGALGASTWRHVAFIEQKRDRIEEARESGRALVDLGMPSVGVPASAEPASAATASANMAILDTPEFRWLISSDVCKHCTHA